MNITKEELSLIVDNTTTAERQAASDKSGYSLVTTRNILYNIQPVNLRNTVVIRLLHRKALANIRRDLNKLEKLTNKLK